jgi:hypothetical protein
MRAPDTDERSKAVQDRVLGALSGADRMRLAFELSDLARELALARLRLAHPDYTERRLRIELLGLTMRPAALPPNLR